MICKPLKLITKKRVVLFTLLLLFTGSSYIIGWNVGLRENPIIQLKPGLDQDVVWALVQNFRLENNLKTYEKSQKLCEIAKGRAGDILSEFSHRIFSEKYDGKTPYLISENIARGFLTEKATLDGWLKSASHSAALRADYQYSCIQCINLACVELFANSSY